PWPRAWSRSSRPTSMAATTGRSIPRRSSTDDLFDLNTRALDDAVEIRRVALNGLSKLLGRACDHGHPHAREALPGVGELEDAHELGVELGDDVPVNARGHQEADPGDEIEAGKARLRHRRHPGQRGGGLGPDRKST